MEQLTTYQFHEKEWRDYEQLYEDFTWEIPETFNIAEYVCDRWAEDEDRVAIYAEGGDGDEETYTFGRLQRTANQLANYLQSQGIGRGDRIGICAPPKPEVAITHIAAWKLGAVSIPLDILLGPDGIEYRLTDSDMDVCIVDRENVDTFRNVDVGVEMITVDCPDRGEAEVDFWTALEGEDRHFSTTATAPEDDAFIVYTSGTTGDPKGVLHAHRVVLGFLPAFLTTYSNLSLRDADVFGAGGTFGASIGSMGFWTPALYYGKPIVAYEENRPFDPEETFELLEKYRTTSFVLPATAIRMMMQVEKPSEMYDLESVRLVSIGGEAVGSAVTEWVDETFGGATVHEIYGQTEANIVIGDCTALGVEHKQGKMGKPIPGHEIEIVDPDTADVVRETDEVGEIAVRYESDPVCFKEYLNKPEKTDAKVNAEWLLTEDLGKKHDDGYLSFESRKDNVIISSAYRISPEEVEEHLSTHEAVAIAGVIGVPDEQRGKVPKAFVEPAEDFDPAEELKEDLMDHVKNNLAKYEYPREIEFLDSMPRTPTEKVARSELEEREG